RMRKPEQRHSRNNTGAEQENGKLRRRQAKVYLTAAREKNQVTNCQRRDDSCFEKKTRCRPRAGDFAEEPIEAKGSAKGQCYPGQLAKAKGKVCNRDRREQDGDELGPRETFV